MDPSQTSGTCISDPARGQGAEKSANECTRLLSTAVSKVFKITHSCSGCVGDPLEQKQTETRRALTCVLAGQTPFPSEPSPRRLSNESSLRWKRWKYEMGTYQRLQLEGQEVEAHAHAELRRAELRRVPPAQPRPTRPAARGRELECTHSAQHV